MATSTPGIGSGLDVNAIVNQMVAVERQPLQKLQQRATAIQAQVSSWGKLKSQLDTLNTAITRLGAASTWTQSTVNSSDATAVTAAVASSGTASPGRYTIQVNQLAQEQSLVSASMPTGADMRGRLTIELGAYDSATPPGFAPRAGSTALQLDFSDNPTSLAAVRDSINTANAGVRASILNDGSGQRLVITGTETGAERGFRVTSSDPSGTGAAGLSALSYDGGVSSTMSLSRSARNASFTVNGVSLTLPTNTLDGTVEGLRIQLVKAGGSTDLIVENDVASQKKLIEDFVAAYNAVNNQVSADTSYDAASKKGGPLFGDAGALAVRRLLRDMVGQSSTASSVFSRLSDLGMDIKRDGAISVNGTTLGNALARPAEVGKLMSASGSGTEESKGLAVRLKALMEPMLASDGLVDGRSDSLRERLKRNQSDQERLNTRVEATRQRLLRLYQSLDGRVAQLNGLGSYVSQQFGSRG